MREEEEEKEEEVQQRAAAAELLLALRPYMYRERERAPSPPPQQQQQKPPIPTEVLVESHGHEDAFFWCLYIAKHGYREYAAFQQMTHHAGGRKRFELELKQTLIEQISANMRELMQRKCRSEFRFTKTKILEVLSGMQLAEHKISDCLYSSLLACKSLGLGVLLVDAARGLCVPLNLAEAENENENATEENENENATEENAADQDDTDDTDDAAVFVVRRLSGARFAVDLSTTRASLAALRRRCVDVLVGPKPLATLSCYKKPELQRLADVLGLAWADGSTSTSSLKKEELYAALWVRMQWLGANAKN